LNLRELNLGLFVFFVFSADFNHLSSFVGAAKSACAMRADGFAAFWAMADGRRFQSEVGGAAMFVRRCPTMSGETHTKKIKIKL